jgi:hypothetical protein
MTSRTRCDLALVICEGQTYAIPRDGSPIEGYLGAWAKLAGVEWLDILVPAGTEVTVARGGVVAECDVLGFRAFVPRDLLEDLH